MTASTVAARERVAAFDVLRAVAAVAVVVIHVLGPYRGRLGEMPDSQWAIAVALNGLCRWSVPVFIMITGALLLADSRPFELGYFLRRRVSKVLIPFVAWSLGYAVLAGLSIAGYDAAVTVSRLVESPTQETYYHLGFFYYFIPLYLLIPALRPLADPGRIRWAAAITGAWLVLTVLYLFHADGIFGVDLLMYGGYLLFGYLLFRYRGAPMLLFGTLALAAVVITDYSVIDTSLEAGRYQIGRWFSYKTVNTVVVAAFVFAAILAYAPRLPERALRAFEFVGRYSLGIYLIHPIFLWPVRELNLYHGHPLIIIPLWTLVCSGLALAASWLLTRSRVTAWLVP